MELDWGVREQASSIGVGSSVDRSTTTAHLDWGTTTAHSEVADQVEGGEGPHHPSARPEGRRIQKYHVYTANGYGTTLNETNSHWRNR